MSQIPKGRKSATRSSLPAVERDGDPTWPSTGRENSGSQSTPHPTVESGPRTGPAVMALAVLVWALAVTVGIVAWVHRPDQSAGGEPRTGLPPTQSATADPSAGSEPTPSDSAPSGLERSGRPSRESPKKEPKKDPRPKIPASGSGTYTRQQQSAKPSGDSGRVIRYDVRVEKGLPYKASDVADTIHEILNDERSWMGTGEWRFKLVGPGEQAELHAYLTTPKTTDELCAPLLTGGEVSCRNGERVVLNAKRWAFGAEAYGEDVTNYRRYLVNHEFGHFLGFGHVDCPGDDRPAPIMMQQTKGLDGCKRNPWPAGDD